jgi:transposase
LPSKTHPTTRPPPGPTPRDKGKVEGAVLIVERWVLARLRNRTFFSLAQLNAAIAELLEELNNRPMRHVGKSRRELFEEIEKVALKPVPSAPFEYAEWKTAKVHPDYHVEVDKTFYSVPHRLIGRQVNVRLTHRVVEIFHDYQRVASHVRRSQRSGHVTVNAHMPKAHQRYANTTPANLIGRAQRIGNNVAILVERLMHDRPHPEQGYRAAMGILSLSPRYGRERLEAACERALTINAVSYSSVNAILKSGLDRSSPMAEPAKPAPTHKNIRGSAYYQ